MLEEVDGVTERIAKQRVVFFVKHLVSWLHEPQGLDQATSSEVLKAIFHCLPAMKDMYGNHWSQVLQFLDSLWYEFPPMTSASSTTAVIPLLRSSMQLMTRLRTFVSETDANEDLQETWTEQKSKLANGLLNVLEAVGSISDEFNQPLSIVNQQLARILSDMPPQIKESSDLYHLIAAQSIHVQKAAFGLLHDQIPRMQEQKSVEVVLDKSVARLSDELLSLINAKPLAANTKDVGFRGYLTSWLLIFDHFQNAVSALNSLSSC